MNGYKLSQYAMAVLLIASSIALAAFQVFTIQDVANGLLLYIAQAFMLAGSIFGLDYYVNLISKKIKSVTNEKDSSRNTQQQPA